jgi:peptidoglycan lytic transglycosylase
MRWWRGAAAAAAIGVVVSACSLIRPTTPPVVGGQQEGVASWYGPGFHGRRTANGEVYDQYELTAAHQTLALGTRVMVTSATNGRSVEVRVNDRGPFVDGRIIDLSYAAARVIGMIGPGTMPVRLQVLDAGVEIARRPAPPAPEPRPVAVARAEPRRAPDPPPRAEPAEPRGSYAVLVATLSDPGLAEHLRSRIAIKFPDAHVAAVDVRNDRYYRVQIGPYEYRRLAVARAELVGRYGYPAVITEDATP